MGDCDIHIFKKALKVQKRIDATYRSWLTYTCSLSCSQTHTLNIMQYNKMDKGNKRTTYHLWRRAPILFVVCHSNNFKVSCLLLQILDVEKCLFDTNSLRVKKISFAYMTTFSIGFYCVFGISLCIHEAFWTINIYVCNSITKMNQNIFSECIKMLLTRFKSHVFIRIICVMTT